MRMIDADDLMKKYELIDWYSVSKSGGLMRGATSEDNPVIHYYDGEEVIKNAPTIEAEPVRHGEWVLGDVEPGYFTPGGNRPWICSECGQVVSWMLGKPNEKYCHNCGCKMDGESDE